MSQVEILTRPKGAQSGASLHLEGGVPGPVEEAGAPEGTTVTVRDLFYNTPARLKFMKKDSAETAAVAGLLQHLAMSHPDISFQLIKDGAEALHTPGDGKLESAIYAALGREFARSLLAVEGRGGEVAVEGYVTMPPEPGLPVHAGVLCQRPVYQVSAPDGGAGGGLPQPDHEGKFPGCVLSVTLPVTAVDVNVHPAKTTVKFAREKEVFDAVYHTVLDCLSAREARCKPPGAWSRWSSPAGLLPVSGRQDLSGADGAGGLPAPERGEARLGQRAALHGPCGGQRPSGLRLWEVPGCGRRPGKASGIGSRPNRGRDFAGR